MKLTLIRSIQVCLCVAVALLSGPVRGQDVPSGLLVTAPRLFTDADGLPSNTVERLLRDRRGYLWATTPEGVAVYNGRRWTPFPLPNSDRMNYVRPILEAADGAMWFGTSSGVLVYRNGGWTTFSRESGHLPHDTVRALLEMRAADGSSVMWIGTLDGLVCIEHGRWTTFTREQGLPDAAVDSLLETADGRLLVGTFLGLARFENGRFTSAGMLPEALREATVSALLETTGADGTQTLWVGTSRGLARRTADGWTVFTTANGLPSNRVLYLAETVRGNGSRTLWVATYENLARYADGAWTVYDRRAGLPEKTVFCLLSMCGADGSGTMWVGTRGGGIARLKIDGWEALDTRSGFPNNWVTEILDVPFSGAVGGLWFGTRGNGAVRIREGKLSVHPLFHGDGTDWPTSMATMVDDRGAAALWIGGFGGVARYADDRWTMFDGTTPGLPSSRVLALLATRRPDGAPTLIAGTARGLGRFEAGRWSSVDLKAAGFPNEYVNSLLETPSPSGRRTLWVATRGGIGACTDGTWRVFTAATSSLPSDFVVCLHATRSTAGAPILLAGTRRGIAWLDLSQPAAGWRPVVISEDRSSIDLPVYRIVEDRQGRLYLATARGVIRLTPRPPTVTGTVEYDALTYTTADGLPANECTADGAMTIDRDGRIWIGTSLGAAVLDPEQAMEDHRPKPLTIEGRYLGVPEVSFPDDGVLAYNRNNPVFEYALLSFFKETETTYRTQLIGLDESPSAWTTEWKKAYTTLPAGTYVFKVWGRDYAGNVSGPVEIAFVVRPAPWRTWWAYGVYLLGAAGVFWGGYQWRVRRLLARQAMLDALVTERTLALSEAVVEIDALNRELSQANAELHGENRLERERALQARTLAQQAQLQMLRYQLNPHFLFNVLNSIAMLVDEDPHRTQRIVMRLSEFLRYSLHNVDNVTVGEELTVVRHYLEIQAIRFEDQLETTVRLEPEAEKVSLPAFLIQPLVENAVKYGMLTSPSPLKIDVSARVRRGRLELRVANTGRWVDPDDPASTAPRSGIGVGNVRQRLVEAFPERADFYIFKERMWVWARLRIDLHS